MANAELVQLVALWLPEVPRSLGSARTLDRFWRDNLERYFREVLVARMDHRYSRIACGAMGAVAKLARKGDEKVIWALISRLHNVLDDVQTAAQNALVQLAMRSSVEFEPANGWEGALGVLLPVEPAERVVREVRAERAERVLLEAERLRHHIEGVFVPHDEEFDGDIDRDINDALHRARLHLNDARVIAPAFVAAGENDLQRVLVEYDRQLENLGDGALRRGLNDEVAVVVDDFFGDVVVGLDDDTDDDDYLDDDVPRLPRQVQWPDDMIV
jgi:hypothetical protein